MSSHYSRQQKPKKSASIPTKHIKTGFTALQKTIALVGSVLSIVVATITINRALQPSNEQPKNDSSPSTSTIVKIIEKDSSHSNKEETDKTEAYSESNNTQPSNTTPSSADPAAKDTEKQQNTETEAPTANQPAINEPAPNSTSNP